jgi:hypothetical protein
MTAAGDGGKMQLAGDAARRQLGGDQRMGRPQALRVLLAGQHGDVHAAGDANQPDDMVEQRLPAGNRRHQLALHIHHQQRGLSSHRSA